MRIDRIEIGSFGKLKNYEIYLKDGFQAVYGHNEIGKSTIMAFIKMMFYSKLGQGRDIDKNMRLKYQPWDGSHMEGAIDFHIDWPNDHRGIPRGDFYSRGVDYRLQKRIGATPAKDKIELINKLNGEVISLSRNEEVGTYLFGLSLGEFERSGYIGQIGGFSSNGDADELSGKILSNVIASGDESISQTAVLGRLTSAIEDMVSKSKKKGLLVEAREHLEDLRLEKNDITAFMESYERDNELGPTYDRYQKAQAGLSKLSKMKANTEEQLRQLKPTYDTYLETELLLKETKNRKEQNIRDYTNKQIILNANIEMAKADEKAAKEQAEFWSNKDNGRRSAKKSAVYKIPFLILGGVLGIISIILGILVKPSFVLLLIAAGVFITFALAVSPEKEISRRDSHEKKEALLRLSKLQQERQEAELALKSEQAAYRQEMDRRGGQIAAYEKDLQELEGSYRKYLDLQGKLQNEIISRMNQFQVHCEVLKDTLDGLLTDMQDKNQRDIAAIERDIHLCMLDLEEKETYFESLCLAKEVMEEAGDEMRQNFAPELNRITENILKELTDSKYEKVLVSKDFDVKIQSGIHLREWRYLSSGTIDQAYLSLRLAISELISGKNDRMPVLLDDTLMQYDDKRLAKALSFLEEYAKRKENPCQIILFTCHNHVVDMLAKDKVIYL